MRKTYFNFGVFFVFCLKYALIKNKEEAMAEEEKVVAEETEKKGEEGEKEEKKKEKEDFVSTLGTTTLMGGEW